MKRMSIRMKAAAVAVALAVVVTTAAWAGYPVFVTNFYQLAMDYLKQIWNKVVAEMRAEWKQYLNEVLKARGLVETDFDVYQKVASMYRTSRQLPSSETFVTSVTGMYGRNDEFRALVLSVLQEYEDHNGRYLDFSLARDDPEEFHRRAVESTLLTAETPPSLTDEQRQNLTFDARVKLVRQDLYQQAVTATAGYASTALSLAEQVEKDIEAFDPDSWDDAYSEQAVKDTAKMTYNNLRIQTAMLRVLATYVLKETVR